MRGPGERAAERRLRDVRIASGQCAICGIPNRDGTKTMCRRCADRAAERSRKAHEKKAPIRKMLADERRKYVRPESINVADMPRNENGFIMVKCENCFEEVEWKGRGQRTMCDPCRAWFAAPEDENIREARNVRPWSQEKQLNDWQRQG